MQVHRSSNSHASSQEFKFTCKLASSFLLKVELNLRKVSNRSLIPKIKEQLCPLHLGLIQTGSRSKFEPKLAKTLKIGKLEKIVCLNERVPTNFGAPYFQIRLDFGQNPFVRFKPGC